MRISEGNGKNYKIYKFYFDQKYLEINTKVVFGRKAIRSDDALCSSYVKEWVDTIPNIKHEMDLWFYRNRKDERDYQQLVVHENNYGRTSNKTDYFICDIEYAKDNGRFDMVAIKWPSTPQARKSGKNMRLAFIEMKYMDEALKGKSGIIDHIKKMNDYFKNAGRVKELEEEMKEIFNLKIKLGLLEGIKKIESFAEEVNPECILLLANHDPSSKVLYQELEKLYKSPLYSSFKQKADLKISISSCMGYGLYQECIKDFDDFMNINI
jgi:hypothetical protein